MPPFPEDPVGLKTRLKLLMLERQSAKRWSLDANRLYMAALADEIACTERAYVLGAVAEIARLRARLDRPLWG